MLPHALQPPDLPTLAITALRTQPLLQHPPRAVKPRVIDAGNIMSSPAAVRGLCRETSLATDAVQYKYEP